MATRAMIVVYDEDRKPLVGIYKHWDGYPSALGMELAQILGGKKIVNGYGLDTTMKTHANGMSCLAAQIVAGLKTEIGDVYITRLKEDGSLPDKGQEYVYHIYEDDIAVDDVYRDVHIITHSWQDRTPEELVGLMKNFQDRIAEI